MTSLTELVGAFIEVRGQRLELEKEADDLKKNTEEPLKAQILQLMSAQGLKSANVEGLGRVVAKETKHYEIMDIEALAFQMLKVMVEAAQEGRPVSDGLLLQRRVHRENLDTMLDGMGEITDEKIAGFGVRKAVKVELAFTKA